METPDTEPTKGRWASLIADLYNEGKGMTFAEIGNATGLSRGAIGDIHVGRTKSPRGDAALKLLELHKSRCCSVGDSALAPS